jgi:hypothetical protein
VRARELFPTVVLRFLRGVTRDVSADPFFTPIEFLTLKITLARGRRMHVLCAYLERVIFLFRDQSFFHGARYVTRRLQFDVMRLSARFSPFLLVFFVSFSFSFL